MAERPKEPKPIDVSALLDKKMSFELRTAESPEELQSRLRREEAEDAHKRRIGLVVHVFVMTVIAVAFLTSAYLTVAGDPKSVLSDRAMSVVMVIVAGAVGYLTGRGSK